MNRRAFTLLELIVVLAIVALCAALLLCAVQQVRVTATRVACQSQLRQFGLAFAQYHNTHGRLPTGVGRFPERNRSDNPDPLAGNPWLAHLLPYLEQEATWAKIVHAFDRDPYLTEANHSEYYEIQPKIFVCPADDAARRITTSELSRIGITSYLGVSGLNRFRRTGLLYYESRLSYRDVTDGTSTTLLVGERPHFVTLRGFYGSWCRIVPPSPNTTGYHYLGVQESGVDAELAQVSFPHECPPGRQTFQRGRPNHPCNLFHFWSLHPSGANFLFADGSVRFGAYGIAGILPDLASRAGGEVVDVDW